MNKQTYQKIADSAALIFIAWAVALIGASMENTFVLLSSLLPAAIWIYCVIKEE